jgi:hypothetical protein
MPDNRRRHDVPTGRRDGAPEANANAVRHGLKSAAYIEHRRVVTKAIREANQLARDLVGDSWALS